MTVYVVLVGVYEDAWVDSVWFSRCAADRRAEEAADEYELAATMWGHVEECEVKEETDDADNERND